jgi:hypothetical protein
MVVVDVGIRVEEFEATIQEAHIAGIKKIVQNWNLFSILPPCHRETFMAKA